MPYTVRDHPDIEAALRTGYPRQPSRVYCEGCGKNITYLTQYEDEHHNYLCSECLLYYHRKEY